MTQQQAPKLRHLVLVLGDQMSLESSAFDGFDVNEEALLMMEVAEEATYVPQHKVRLALFFSAMRHFRSALQDRGCPIHYVELEDQENLGSFAKQLGRWIHKLRPEKIILCQPGDYRVAEASRRAVAREPCELEIRPDRHVLCTGHEFQRHVEGRKALVMEHCYRDMRRRHEVLITPDGPVGGRWNLDADNRKTFGRRGPGRIETPRSFVPDKVTEGVLKMVQRRFADNPGSLKQTEMNCLQRCLGQLVDHAYAHHIQRLMVLGLYALLLGVRPYEVHRWHMPMYDDAIDWASLPNVLGMSQYGGGGIVGSKPYAASGSYINRMSDYCSGCRYDPKQADRLKSEATAKIWG